MPSLSDSGDPLPFEQLFLPLVRHASKELRRLVSPEVYGLLTLNAHGGWERYLLGRLTGAGAKAAHWQFQIFRTVRAAFPAQNRAGRSTPDYFFRQFVGEPTEDRLQKLFGEFPALKALCHKLIGNWLSAVTRFLSHLDADRCEFSVYFRSENLSGQITKITAGLSDPHRGGHSVLKIHFERGGALIYKPRSLAPEALFSDFIGQLNGGDNPLSLKAGKCWDRGEYGWMENISRMSCNSLEDVQAFYWRAGALLGIVSLARGVDIHQGNLVASGGFPVLVDLETLWHSPPLGNATPLEKTGMLPQVHFRTGQYDRWSALSQTFSNRVSALTWIYINQDGMTQTVEYAICNEQNHLPILRGKMYMASDFVEDVVAGYRWMGKKLLEKVEDQRALLKWLHNLAACTRRRVIRSSIHYGPSLARFTSPDFLRAGSASEDYSVEGGQRKEMFSGAEIRALMQLDLPYFQQVQTEHVSSENSGPTIPSLKSYLAQTRVILKLLAAPE